MKLNRLQRHTAYIIMLAEAEKMNSYESLCGLWSNKITGRWPNRLHLLLPELFKNAIYKNRNWYWFDNKRQRIEALIKCVNKTA